MQIIKAGLFYFAAVFAAGLVLGVIRVLWIVPRIGPRAAELSEMPLMAAVIVFSARWMVRRFSLPPVPTARLGAGLAGLMILLMVEFTVVLGLQGLTLGEYFQSRDVAAGTAYLVMLAVYATMPLFVCRNQGTEKHPPARSGS
jgi:hypothetical protein